MPWWQRTPSDWDPSKDSPSHATANSSAMSSIVLRMAIGQNDDHGRQAHDTRSALVSGARHWRRAGVGAARRGTDPGAGKALGGTAGAGPGGGQGAGGTRGAAARATQG